MSFSEALSPKKLSEVSFQIWAMSAQHGLIFSSIFSYTFNCIHVNTSSAVYEPDRLIYFSTVVQLEFHRSNCLHAIHQNAQLVVAGYTVEFWNTAFLCFDLPQKREILIGHRIIAAKHQIFSNISASVALSFWHKCLFYRYHNSFAPNCEGISG